MNSSGPLEGSVPAESSGPGRRRPEPKARIRLVLVGGEPGTGKSTLAARLADAGGWMLLSSLQVRASLTGSSLPLGLLVDWTARPVDSALQATTYSEMLRHARLLLERGQSVILDATWSDSSMRARAASLAKGASADFVAVRCDAGDALRDARIRERISAGPAIADAVVDICRRIAAEFHPWPEATVIDTRQPLSGSLAAALRAIDSQPQTVSSGIH